MQRNQFRVVQPTEAGSPFEVVHERVGLSDQIHENSVCLTLLYRDVAIQTLLHLKAVLEPSTMALPAIVVRHETDVPAEAAATWYMRLHALRRHSVMNPQIANVGTKRSSRVLDTPLFHEHPRSRSGVDDQDVSREKSCVDNVTYTIELHVNSMVVFKLPLKRGAPYFLAHSVNVSCW